MRSDEILYLVNNDVRLKRVNQHVKWVRHHPRGTSGLHNYHASASLGVAVMKWYTTMEKNVSAPNVFTNCIKFSSICTESMVAADQEEVWGVFLGAGTNAVRRGCCGNCQQSFLLPRLAPRRLTRSPSLGKHGVSLTRISVTRELTKGAYYPFVGLGQR